MIPGDGGPRGPADCPVPDKVLAAVPADGPFEVLRLLQFPDDRAVVRRPYHRLIGLEFIGQNEASALGNNMAATRVQQWYRQYAPVRMTGRSRVPSSATIRRTTTVRHGCRAGDARLSSA